MKKVLFNCLITSLILSLSACGAVSKVVNPFYEEPSEVGVLGEASDRALNSSSDKEENARKALEAVATHQSAKLPQPYNPVVQPSVIRLMWVPDHLNKNGDLVPAHYYYVKVLSDRWSLSDAFELEDQLNKGGTDAGSIPYVTDPGK